MLCPSGQYIVRRPVAADDGALDGGGQSGVDPVAGQEQPGTAVRVPGRAGWPGASENDACGSRTTVARTSTALRASGTASVSSRQASAISSSFDWRSTASAPLDTSERWPTAAPGRSAPRS